MLIFSSWPGQFLCLLPFEVARCVKTWVSLFWVWPFLLWLAEIIANYIGQIIWLIWIRKKIPRFVNKKTKKEAYQNTIMLMVYCQFYESLYCVRRKCSSTFILLSRYWSYDCQLWHIGILRHVRSREVSVEVHPSVGSESLVVENNCEFWTNFFPECRNFTWAAKCNPSQTTRKFSLDLGALLTTLCLLESNKHYSLHLFDWFS